MLKDEIKVLWKAIDKIVLEDKHLSSYNSNYQRYILAKTELIKESYVIRKLLGESKEALTTGYVNNVRDYIVSSKNILNNLARKNSLVAESIIKGDKIDKKLLHLESLMFGDVLYSRLLESNLPKKTSIGLSLAETVFTSAAKTLLDISSKL